MLTVACPKLTQPVCNEWELVRISSSSKSGHPGWDGSRKQASKQAAFAGHTQFVWPSKSAAAWSSTCCRASSLETPLAKVEASACTCVDHRVSGLLHHYERGPKIPSFRSPVFVSVVLWGGFQRNSKDYAFYVRDPVGGCQMRAQRGPSWAFVGVRELTRCVKGRMDGGRQEPPAAAGC